MTTSGPARRAALVAVAILGAASLVAACGEDDDGDVLDVSGDTVEVTDVWARTSPAVASAGAVYMTITNGGSDDDALVAASVDATVAASVEIHETAVADGDDGGMDPGTSTETTGMDGDMATDTTAMGGGMMEMRPVDEIAIPAGETVALEPGGYHVMLLDLASPLELGGEIELTLTFAEVGEVTVTAEILDTAP